MSSHVHAAALRQLLLRLHFFAGILIAPFLAVAALTGLLYAVSYPVEDVLYDDLRTADAVHGDRLPLADQVLASSDAYPDWTVTGVRPALDERDTTAVLFDDGIARDSGAVAVVYVNPYTAAVQGDSTSYGSSQAGPFREWVATLHRNLHLGEPGRLYSELAASWLWLVALGGLALWLSRRRRSGALFWPRRGTTGRSRSMSRHAAVGMWLILILLFLSVTGLTWSRYAGDNIAALRAELDWTTPSFSVGASGHGGHGGHGAHDRHGEAAPAVDSLDAVYATGRDFGLEGPLEITLPNTEGGDFAVAETRRSIPVEQDRIAVAVDPSGRAEVTDALLFADWPFMARATSVAIAAHMGLLFGLPNQLLLAAAMLTLMWMIGLGYRMWWERRGKDALVGKPYPPGGLRRLPWPLTAVLAAAAAVVGWFLPLLGVPLAAFLVIDLLSARLRRGDARPRPASDADPAASTTGRTP